MFASPKCPECRYHETFPLTSTRGRVLRTVPQVFACQDACGAIFLPAAPKAKAKPRKPAKAK